MGDHNTFDGINVDQHRGRFVGTFDIDENDVAAVGLDRAVLCVVAARVSKATPEIVRGQLKRTNVLAVSEVRFVVDPDLRDAIASACAFPGSDQLRLDFEDAVDSPEPVPEGVEAPGPMNNVVPFVPEAGHPASIYNGPRDSALAAFLSE